MSTPIVPLGSLGSLTGRDAPTLLSQLNATIRRLGTVNALLVPFTIAPPPVTRPANIPTQQWAQTWNTSTAQTALLLNVTDTSSPAASLLLDLQVNGVSKFSVRKDGLTTITPTIGVTTLTINPGPLIVGTDPGGADIVRIGGNITLLSGSSIGANSGVTGASIVFDATPRIRFNTGGTDRARFTTSTLEPIAAGGLSLGTAALPWNTIFGRSLLLYDSAGGLRANISDSGGNTGFELGRIDGTAGTAFIDFHSGATAVDFDSRLSATGGSGVSGGGVVSLTAASFIVAGSQVRLDAASNAHYEFYLGGVRKAGLSVIAADTIRLTDSAGTVKAQFNLGGTAGKFIPPATSWTWRDNADSADNLSMTDAGLAALRNKIHVGLNSTQATEPMIFGLSVTKDVANGAGGPGAFAFAAETVAIDSTSDVTGVQHLSGLQTAAVVTAAGNYHELWGAHIYSLVSLGGTCDLAIGGYNQVLQTAGTLTVGVGVEADVGRSGGTMGTAILVAAGYHSTHPTQGLNAVATNQYGVRVGPIINGTLNYAWYSENGLLRFGDDVVFQKGNNVSLGTADNFGVSFKTNALVRWSIGNTGNLEGDTTNGGSIKLGPAVSKIVAGATSLSLRNNADTQDNILILDAGTTTIRGALTLLEGPLNFTRGAAFTFGTTDAFGLSIKTNALIRTSWDTSGNQVADTSNGGYITYRMGTSSVTAKSIGAGFQSNNATTTSTTTATLTGGSNGGTYTLKANTLNVNGATLRIKYDGFISATTGTFTLTLGGATLISAIALSSNGTFSGTVYVTRRDSTHIDWTHEGMHFNAATVTDLNRAENVNVDLTTDLTVNFQGSAASGTLTGKLCHIVHEAA